jgi:hypothetical protein
MTTIFDRIAALTPDQALRTRIACLVAEETAVQMRDARAAMPPKDASSLDAAMMTLTPEVCARSARCSRRTIDNAIKARAILAAKGSTGLVAVDRASFNAWNAARTPKPALTEAQSLEKIRKHWYGSGAGVVSARKGAQRSHR